MSVVNVKVANIRPQYKNLEEWINDNKNVYIGRVGIVFIDKQRYPKNSSPFCNPFKIDKDGTRDEVIQKYEVYIREKLDKDSSLKEELLKMKGKNLGCWCYPEKCHGDVLLKLLEDF